jgi:hypothetical protein
MSLRSAVLDLPPPIAITAYWRETGSVGFERNQNTLAPGLSFPLEDTADTRYRARVAFAITAVESTKEVPVWPVAILSYVGEFPMARSMAYDTAGALDCQFRRTPRLASAAMANPVTGATFSFSTLGIAVTT